MSPKKPKIAPEFTFGDAQVAELVKVAEPHDVELTAAEEAPMGPDTGLAEPLKESVPYEEERRSYNERRQSQGIWKGIERRGGEDRRKAPRAAKVSIFPRKKPKTDKPKSSRRKLPRKTIAVLAAWVTVLVIFPGLVYWKRGWEASLAAFVSLTLASFTHLFFYLNRRN